MRIRITQEDNALYVRFSDEAIVETAEVCPSVMFDYDEKGRIVAFEILNASQMLSDIDTKKLAVNLA